MSDPAGRLHGDEPITSRAQDLLGREGFAVRVARDLLNAPVRRGFVISVMGEWGSGKTSVLKLIEENIGQEAVSLWFNPWMFSSAEELVSRFFAEVAAQLEGNQDEEVRDLASRVASYGKALAPLAQILVPGVGGLLNAGADALAGTAGQNPVSAHQRYDELANALSEIHRRVVVYVDDIDRLRDDEIREVMRLVKLVGDLPNVVYVLAYDRVRVEKALASAGTDARDGRAYIEKIVQVPHSLPPSRASALHKIALDDLDAALGQENFPFFDERRWGDLFHQGIAPMINTLRDARRFANAASLSARMLRDEVTGEDLLALEALRVFEPDIHAALPRIAPLLTRASRAIHSQDRADEEQRRQIEPVLAEARDAASVKTLLSALFPAGAYLLGGSREEPDQRIWRHARRVASTDVLDIYLHASFGEDAIATGQVLKVVASLSDGQQLSELLTEIPDEALPILLDRVGDYQGGFGPDDTAAAPVFLDLFPRLQIGPNFSLFPPEWALRSVLHSLIAAAPDERRVSLVRELFATAPSLTARWYVTMWFAVSDEPRHAQDPARVLDVDAAEELSNELRQLVVDASPASLRFEPRLLTVLLCLLRNDEDQEAQEIGRQKLSDDELMLSLLANALKYADWFQQLERLTGRAWLAERTRMLVDRFNGQQLEDAQASALAHAHRRATEATEGGTASV